jgi:hypothetical protein
MPRIGEVSPVCVGGRWETQERGVGATFVGSNVRGDRSWDQRMRVVVADPPHQFAWENIGGSVTPPSLVGARLARWSYCFTRVDAGTRVDESWRVLDLDRQIDAVGRDAIVALTRSNRDGIRQTLAALKVRFEA